MSNSSPNPFASPGPLARVNENGVEGGSIEVRPVAFSGRMEEEEIKLLSGHKSLRWVDSILLLPIVFIVALGIYQVRTFGFSGWPDALMIGTLFYVTFNAVIAWSALKQPIKMHWLSETTEGAVNENDIVLRFADSQINLATKEHKTHLNVHGIRIALGGIALGRRFLISRHWFLPGDFEIACELIKNSKSVDNEQLESFSLLNDRPDSAIAVYRLAERIQQRNSLLQPIGSRFALTVGSTMLLLGIAFNAIGVWMGGPIDSGDWVVNIALPFIGAFMLAGFGLAQLKIHLDMNHPSSFDPVGRELLGWIDTSGFVMRTKHDIIKSSWNEHLCYISFVGSLNLHCSLSNPMYVKLFPQSFASLEDWQRAKSIIETNVSTLEQHIKKNRPSWLKLLNRV